MEPGRWPHTQWFCVNGPRLRSAPAPLSWCHRAFRHGARLFSPLNGRARSIWQRRTASPCLCAGAPFWRARHSASSDRPVVLLQVGDRGCVRVCGGGSRCGLGSTPQLGHIAPGPLLPLVGGLASASAPRAMFSIAPLRGWAVGFTRALGPKARSNFTEPWRALLLVVPSAGSLML